MPIRFVEAAQVVGRALPPGRRGGGGRQRTTKRAAVTADRVGEHGFSPSGLALNERQTVPACHVEGKCLSEFFGWGTGP